MNKHDPLIATALSVSIRSRQEPEMFDHQVAVERKAVDLQNTVTDLIHAHGTATEREYVEQNEARLLSAYAGLQWLCSAMRESRLKRQTLQAAE